jgi:hypothetical protein
VAHREPDPALSAPAGASPSRPHGPAKIARLSVTRIRSGHPLGMSEKLEDA